MGYFLSFLVYDSMGYRATVDEVAELSMKAAVQSVVGAEWVITDARHDSTANAFHTTVPCLSGRQGNWNAHAESCPRSWKEV
jgi:hypothetical protein